VLKGGIDPAIGTVPDPLHVRICEVCDALGYKHVQYWEVSDDGERAYLSRDPDRYSITKSDTALVAQVWRTAQPAIRYGVTRANVRFPDLLPEANQSWIGYPILRRNRVTSILSCLDRARAVRPLTVLDLPVMEALGSIIGVERELALQLQANLHNRQSQSHAISGHLQNVMLNLKVLTYAVEGREMPTEAGQERPRTPQVILRNIHSFLALAVRSLNLEDFTNLDEYTVNPVQDDIYRCVAETVAMLRILLKSELREYTIVYDSFRDVRKFDYSAVQEVLVILLLNAAKYTRSPIPVRITHPGPGVLQIKNLGIGIPPGEEDLIFERTKQGSNVTPEMALQCESRSGHKGLGLYIARNIMEKTGGSVRLLQPGRSATDKERLAVSLGHGGGIAAEGWYTVFEVSLKG
jgi:signal transduction histidine kinase